MKKILFTLLLRIACVPAICYGQVQNMGRVNVFSSSDTDKIIFEIVPVFNGVPLALNDRYYVNSHGDTLYVDMFRFYMTNISFIGTHNAINTNSHLFDAEDTDTHSFLIKNIPGGEYGALQFIIGVDSTANTSGANEGDLDPSNGMYWAWNSGYIMAKLQGHSSVCKTLHHAFEFHIGGYMSPDNAARTVTLKLPKPAVVGKRGIPIITIKADVAAWFNGQLDLTKVNNIAVPGKDACQMADRYAKMFSVDAVDLLSCNK